jgi:hypothetical protein
MLFQGVCLANCNHQEMQFATELVNLHAVIIIVVLCMQESILGLLGQLNVTVVQNILDIRSLAH